MKVSVWLCSAFTLLSATFAMAADVQLKVGDAAPPLQVGKWIKGDPVAALEPGKVYVLEFWATWCGPCVHAIPHVSELQQKKPEVTFIGVNVWENAPEKVQEFVDRMGDKMSYRVVLDDLAAGADEGAMAIHWLKAAGENGIPSTFVVGKDGKILWIGHPMELDPVLNAILDGSFDPAKAQQDAEKKAFIEKKFMEALDGVQTPEDALAALQKLSEESPDLKDATFPIRFNIMIRALDDYDGAYKLIAEHAEAKSNDPMLLNEMSWLILTAPDLKRRDIPLAKKMAEMAVEASKGKDAAILDTLARAYFEEGREKAIELQKKALLQASDDDRAIFQGVLDSYMEFDPHRSTTNPEDEPAENEDMGTSGSEDSISPEMDGETP